MKLELPQYNFCPRCAGPVTLIEKEGRIRPVCSSCGFVIYVNPIPATSLIILHDGRVLLTLRDVNPHRGEWCLPGGFLEWDESSEEGAKRELYEETGITAHDLSLVGVYDSITEITRHVIVIIYRAFSWEGDLLAGDDASEVAWFPLSSMPRLAFTAHQQALGDALRNREHR